MKTWRTYLGADCGASTFIVIAALVECERRANLFDWLRRVGTLTNRLASCDKAFDAFFGILDAKMATEC